ncbi:hypothetical protein GH714_026638 [Hevea brasiliensis]|uniref:RNA helicase n=1 Tax=Hevea brasiliensis TaxID=3981 RepID=A0A6A6M4R4_HEVBR|nr:hypothetical protein GH714_026638 [Hevea brasiliensis]
MASSVIGVSSILHTPSIELSSRRPHSANPTLSSSSFSLHSCEKSHFSSLVASGGGGGGGGRPPLVLQSSAHYKHGLSFVPSAIATSNSILSEEAFKGLSGGLPDFDDDDDDDVGSRDYESETETAAGESLPDEDELAISKLEGRDLIARAKTGTGKTLAFGIPIIKRLTEDTTQTSPQRRTGRLPRVLVLAPTRELAKQVEKEINETAHYLNTVCVYGGVSYITQRNALSRGVDVVVGTPGRIIDLINSNSLKLGEVEYLVLDEADQMLSFGFEEDVEVILENLPSKRQSMLFSATMPTWVKKLARKYLDNPLQIDLVGDQEEKLAEGIKLYAISTTATSKRSILSDLVTVYAKGGKTIIFTQTKRDADEVSMALTNSIASEALHGDISQHQRERTLNGFRQGKFTVLVATDVASRGLDIPNVDLVIHYELPNDPETFVHRSGRTGRAGKEGTAILMFTGSQRRTVRSLERDVGCKFEFVSPPATEQVLESSAEQVVAALNGVHPESVEFFTPTAQRLIEEQGTSALAAALAHLSGFSQPPSSRSLINHEQGWITLQLTRDPSYSRGYLSVRSVTGFLNDVYTAAADEVGKIYLIADEKVQGAVFDLPEEIAKELLNKQLPPGNNISKITKLPSLQDDGPPSDYYGRFSSRDRGARGGSRGGQRGFRASRGWGGGRDFSDDAEDTYRRGPHGLRSYSRSRSSDDWLISGRRSSRPSPRDRSFGGACFNCGQPGHRASNCPNRGAF